MSKCKYEFPFSDLTGKVYHDKNFSTRILYGVKHTYLWNPDNEVEQTPNRVLHQAALQLANIRVKEIVSNPEQLQQVRKTVSFPNMPKRVQDKLPLWRFRHLLLGVVLRDIKEKAQSHDVDTIHALMAIVKEDKAPILASFLPE